MTQTKTCGECSWWHGRGRAKRLGKCRRHAPWAVVYHNFPQSTGDPVWPVTLALDGCGDFTAREPGNE